MPSGTRSRRRCPRLVSGPRHAVGEPVSSAWRAHDDGRAGTPRLARCTSRTRTPKLVIDVAKGLEGLRRQDGIHGRSRRHHPRAADRVPARPAQARAGAAPGDAPIVHAVRDARRRGPWPFEDGFLGCASSLSVIEMASTSSNIRPGSVPTSTRCRSTTSGPSRCCGEATPSACSARGRRHARRRCARWRPTSFDDVAALVAFVPAGPDGGQHAP